MSGNANTPPSEQNTNVSRWRHEKFVIVNDQWVCVQNLPAGWSPSDAAFAEPIPYRPSQLASFNRQQQEAMQQPPPADFDAVQQPAMTMQQPAQFNQQLPINNQLWMSQYPSMVPYPQSTFYQTPYMYPQAQPFPQQQVQNQLWPLQWQYINSQMTAPMGYNQSLQLQQYPVNIIPQQPQMPQVSPPGFPMLTGHPQQNLIANTAIPPPPGFPAPHEQGIVVGNSEQAVAVNTPPTHPEVQPDVEDEQDTNVNHQEAIEEVPVRNNITSNSQEGTVARTGHPQQDLVATMGISPPPGFPAPHEQGIVVGTSEQAVAVNTPPTHPEIQPDEEEEQDTNLNDQEAIEEAPVRNNITSNSQEGTVALENESGVTDVSVGLPEVDTSVNTLPASPSGSSNVQITRHVTNDHLTLSQVMETVPDTVSTSSRAENVVDIPEASEHLNLNTTAGDAEQESEPVHSTATSSAQIIPSGDIKIPVSVISGKQKKEDQKLKKKESNKKKRVAKQKQKSQEQDDFQLMDEFHQENEAERNKESERRQKLKEYCEKEEARRKILSSRPDSPTFGLQTFINQNDITTKENQRKARTFLRTRKLHYEQGTSALSKLTAELLAILENTSEAVILTDLLALHHEVTARENDIGEYQWLAEVFLNHEILELCLDEDERYSEETMKKAIEKHITKTEIFRQNEPNIEKLEDMDQKWTNSYFEFLKVAPKRAIDEVPEDFFIQKSNYFNSLEPPTLYSKNTARWLKALAQCNHEVLKWDKIILYFCEMYNETICITYAQYVSNN